jgi:hypothetical protein
MSNIGSNEPLLVKNVGMRTDGKQPHNVTPQGLKKDLRVTIALSPLPIIASVSDVLYRKTEQMFFDMMSIQASKHESI